MTNAPPLATVLAAQRAALLRHDAATLRLLVRAWQPVQKRLNTDLERLLAAIGDKPPTANQLRRMVRYQTLIEQTQQAVDAYAAGALPRIVAAQRIAVGLAESHAGTLIGVGGVRVPVEAVNELVGALSDGSPLGDLLRTFGPDVASQAGETLVTGISSGKGLRTVAAEFRRVTGSTATRAALVARTETLRAYRGASLAAYQGSGLVKQWRWLSARQVRTCPTCWARDGKVFPVDEPFVSHPACRCSPIPVLPDVPVRASGPEVFATLPENDQRTILGPGRYELFRNGSLSLTDIPVEVDAGRWGKVLRQRTLGELTR